MSMLSPQQTRAFDDILESEKKSRLVAEKGNRALWVFLVELANQLGEGRLEDLRRKNPHIPACWTLDDWRLFFASVKPALRPVETDWEGAPIEKKADETRFVEENAQLRMALASAQEKLVVADAELKQARGAASQQHFERRDKQKPAPANVQASVVDEALLVAQAAKEPASYAGMVVELREFTQNIPALPETYKALGENGRAWDRYALAIHLLGKWGIAARVEIIGVLSRAVINKNTGKLGVGEGSGSLKGILERLEEQGYVCLGKLGLEKIGVGLNFYRLTPPGEALYQAFERAKPAESEWAHLNRLHEGERFEEHTAACLAFAMHARRRGWSARIMPEVEGKARPDVAVMRDGECINVEVELCTGREENPAKWQNLALSNHGFVALCAATEERRERFIAECRAGHLPGMATDLKTLATPYDDVPLDAGLWASTW